MLVADVFSSMYHSTYYSSGYDMKWTCPTESQLTIEGFVEKVSVHGTVGYTQVVDGHQSIVAVVVVCWVFKVKAALDVVLINLHIRAHILIVGNFLNRK